MKIVGKVAYKLQLLARSHIHPVVHVSQLKKALPSTTKVNPDTPLLWVIVGRHLYLVKLLDIHLHHHRLSTTTMGMVQSASRLDDLGEPSGVNNINFRWHLLVVKQ